MDGDNDQHFDCADTLGSSNKTTENDRTSYSNDFLFDIILNGKVEELKNCLRNGLDVNFRFKFATKCPSCYFNVANFQIPPAEILEIFNTNVADQSCNCGPIMPNLQWEPVWDGKKIEPDDGQQKRRKRCEFPMMHLAVAYGGRPEIVKTLIEHGVTLGEEAVVEHIGGTFENSALVVAAISGSVKCIKLLTNDTHAHLTQFEKSDLDSALFKAVYYNQSGSVEALIKYGIPKGLEIGYGSKTAELVWNCVFQRDTDNAVLRVLVEQGVDVNTSKVNTSSLPITEAIRQSAYDKIEILVSSPTFRTDHTELGSGTTPLMMAVERGDFILCELLLKHGANPNYNAPGRCTDTKESLLSATVLSIQGAPETIVKLLIQYGADVNHCSKDTGYSAIHFAAWDDHPVIVQMLLDAGALHDGCTSDLNTPLSLAAHGNALDSFKLLLARGCNVNNADKDKDTPLLYATYNGNFIMVKDLLDHGADPDFRNNTNTSPLWNACVSGKPEIVQLLLDRNVPLDVKSIGIDQHANSPSPRHLYDTPQDPFAVALDHADYDNRGFIVAQLLVLAGHHITHPWFFEKDVCNLLDLGMLKKHLHWFIGRAQNPQSLKLLSRNILRKELGQDIKEKVSGLEIPTILKDYLLLKELVNVRMPSDNSEMDEDLDG